MTQADLGALLGKTATAISYWEGGQRSPGVDDLVELAGVLRVPATELLPTAAPRVVARAQSELLAIEDLADAVDRVLDRFEEPLRPYDVPRAPSSNPAEAAGFARRRGDQRDAPINVEAIVETCGCHFTLEPLPAGLQGFVIMAGTTPVIVANSNDLLSRQRFTAAHELGHVLLNHHDSFHVDFDQTEGSPPNYNWRHERAANEFAASLLMPEELIRHEVENQIVASVHSLADQFGVSRQAMGIRLAALSIQLG